MKVEKVLSRLNQAPEAVETLRYTGQCLGDELSHRRLEPLRVFRSGIAGLEVGGDTFAQGYLLALADITAAYEAAVEEANTEVEITAALSPVAKEVLLFLWQHPALPKEIAAMLRKDRATVSRTLAKLHRANLVEDYAIEAGSDGRTRPQRLTLLGKRVAQYLNDARLMRQSNLEHAEDRQTVLPAVSAAAGGSI